MSTGTPVYPTTLDTDATLGPTSGIVPGLGGTHLGDAGSGQGTLLGITTNLINANIALETVLGITNSTDPTSHEYRIRRRPWKIWSAYEGMPSATSYATYALVNSVPVLAFNDGSTQATSTVCFLGVVPWGAILTNGVTVRLTWLPSTNAFSPVWRVAFERFGVTDVTTDHFATPVQVTALQSGIPNVASTTPITIPDVGGVLKGESFRIQVTRMGSDPADNIPGDVRLYQASIESA